MKKDFFCCVIIFFVAFLGFIKPAFCDDSRCSINQKKNPEFGSYEKFDKNSKFLKEKLEYFACEYYIQEIRSGIKDMKEGSEFGTVEGTVIVLEEVLRLSGLTWEDFNLSDELVRVYLLNGYMKEIGYFEKEIEDAKSFEKLAIFSEFLKMYEEKYEKLLLRD